jgi:hypothetical protein
MRQGWGEAPRALPAQRGGPRRANRAFRLAWPVERGGEAPPRSEDNALPPGTTCTAEGKANPSRNLGKSGPLWRSGGL